MTAPDVALKQAEDLAQQLGEALSRGDREEACRCSEQLCELQLPVSVQVSSQAYPQDAIQLKVGVGDAQSDSYIPVTMLVSPDMTVSQLKEKISDDYGFSPSLQRWVIGKSLARDHERLYRYGVCQNGDRAYLYIQSAHAAKLTRQYHLLDQQNRCLDSIIESVYTLEPRGLGGGACEKPTPPPKPTQKPPLPPKPPVGWSCLQCTFVNKPTRPGCEICGSERPDGYQPPDIYQPDEQETRRLKQEEMANLLYQQALQDERERNFENLLETDSQSLVTNPAELDCPICYTPVPPGEGATLRECLHNFCRECLKETILNSMDAEVACPYGDNNYSCDSKLQDREIKALLSPEEHQRFLDLRLSIAETRSENSFHCKTPDCPGWCIFEDEVNEFDCELCHEKNCILCQAIHKDMNCKEYQDDLRVRAENDQAAKQTTQMLAGLLQSGEAMNCPKCKVIVQKKDGCDWICCLMCKTEICWVTKQARWGPAGSGDATGGCRCRVNGVLCHPNCQNCH